MIAVYCYDFPHYKTVEGLLTLKEYGHDDVICFAAPYKKLSIIKSSLPIAPSLHCQLPEKIAKYLGYEYRVWDHDLALPETYPVGLILGARILKKEIAEAFPIINLHPGLLPENRGLDNIKWAILDYLPQGVTAHVIDRYIDRGRIIRLKPLPSVEDNLYDIYFALHKLSMEMIDLSISTVLGRGELKPVLKGNLYASLPENLDRRIPELLPEYIKKYPKILEAYWTLQS